MNIIDIIEDTNITLENVQVGDFIYDKTIERLLLKIDKETYTTVKDSSCREPRTYFDDDICEDDTYTTDVKLMVILKDDIKYKKR